VAGEAATARPARPRPLRTAGSGDFADELLDELLPSNVDWRHLVTSYPRAAVVAAAAAGFWLGRTKGGLLMAALTSYVAAQFGDAVIGLTEGEQGGAGGARH
jgi:hypothetical protein